MTQFIRKASLMMLFAFAFIWQALGFAPGHDGLYSLARFKITVLPKFEPAMNTDFGLYWNNTPPGTLKLTSPVLHDAPGSQTIIGLSDLITNSLPPDPNGVLVGDAPYQTSVFETDYRSTKPSSFTGSYPEIVTDVYKMNLTAMTDNNPGHLGDSCACNQPANLPTPWALRAGKGNALPLCPGEVKETPLNHWMSFFDIFCEIDVPTIGTLYNIDPLLVANDDIGNVLPPNVVYKHEDTPAGAGAVPIYFTAPGSKNSVSWVKGEQFGYITLAGHGASFQCADCATFSAAVDQIPELPIHPRVPATSVWGLIGLGLLLVGAAFWIISRKRASTVA
ncbi:MAG: hypothetical protein HY033_07735 [Ignavibacteriae bacterium]|nr:hypothetical protein [Ignavibacteria bacterium]MBI3364782.1 hypothetical protein [Ignavibacteriota bacterium]